MFSLSCGAQINPHVPTLKLNFLKWRRRVAIRRISFALTTTLIIVTVQASIQLASAATDDTLAACERMTNKAKRGECFEAAAKQAIKRKSDEDAMDNFVTKAKQRVGESFFDPDSARYRNLVVTESLTSKMPSRTLCGEVNAKNRYGGYVGYKRFFQTLWLDEGKLDTPKLEGSYISEASRETESRLFELVWQKDCVEPKAIWQQQ